MRVAGYLGAILIAALVHIPSRNAVYGGAVSCNVSPTPTSCSGSYSTSTGCGLFSVSRNGWGLQTKLQAQNSTGNCNTNLDSLGVACRDLSNVNVLNSAACASNIPIIPFF